MSEKRYAIVRVDGEFSCPSQYENIEDKYVCKGGCYPKRSCNNGKVLYGDTKEQLVLKITQVLRTKRALFGITDKQLAKEIVEFLGVE